MGRGRLLVGTSGWSYEHWRGGFYPQELPAHDRLAYYAGHFDTVEINATFYGLPSGQTVRAWHDSVPEDFVFAVKGSRYLTHMRKLAEPAEPVQRLFERVRPLAAKLGPVLWQLPPFLQRDDALLAAFLEGLPLDVRHAVEFRHESWLEPAVFGILEDRNVAAVHVSGDFLRTDLNPTADFTYVRFHGTTRYHGSYTGAHLAPFVRFMEERLAGGFDCYAYFNNDAEGHAPVDARRLSGMLTGHR